MASFKFKNPETGEWDKLGFPISEGMQMELLWENASPTSAFAAQTVTFKEVDMNSLFVVEVAQMAVESSPTSCTIFRVGKAASCNVLISLTGGTNRARGVTASSTTSITFEFGRTTGTGVATPTQDNSAAIPLRIYSVKISKAGVSA